MWGKSIWRPHSIWDMHALQLLRRAALRFPLGNKKHCFHLILFRNLFILSSILPWFDFDEHVHVAPNFLLISHPCTIVLYLLPPGASTETQSPATGSHSHWLLCRVSKNSTDVHILYSLYGFTIKHLKIPTYYLIRQSCQKPPKIDTIWEYAFQLAWDHLW